MAGLQHVIVILVMFTVTIHAVDRGNFKSCSQSGFCKRQRDFKPAEPLYTALLNTVEASAGSIKLHLLNKKNGIRLLLEVFALQDNTARVKVNELEPIKQRYEIPTGDVLIEEPKLDSLEVASNDNSQMKLKFHDNVIIVHASPFRMDFMAGDTPIVQINSQGLLKYEHYRTKDGASDDNEQAVDANPEEEEPDQWEETYKTHQDSKPFGPSSVGMDISFPGFEVVYGIPEHAEDLALKTTKDTDPYRLFNLDVFEYEVRNPMALYGAVPVMLAHNEQRTVGMFWMNAAETWVDISSNTADRGMFTKLVDYVKGDDKIPQVDSHWFSESGIIDLFIMFGPTAKDVFKQYTVLTGTTPLPPLFAMAYHQCRWNYNDEKDVANVDAGFDEHDIPMDVIWLDIEHTDGKRYFTWDGHKFPHSEEMIKNVSAKGRKMVTIVDPHIKKDSNYFIYQQFLEKDMYVKNKDGNDFDGWCWPGSSAWPDFTNPAVREFWATKFMTDQYKGSTNDLHIWNDMNEPSVFNGPEITMHKDAKFAGGWEQRDLHNLYALYVHQATFEGLLLRGNNNERPFVLSRGFYAGSQRFGAIWTGDNMAEWSHLKVSLPMVLTLNLVGIVLSGADVGGFFHNPETELLTRWYQTGAYMPFFRAHAHLDSRRREPWLQPPEHKEIIRDAIRARYRLLPYWYTQFRLHELTGVPVARPLWVEFPDQKDTFKMEDVFMIGSHLLVRPVTDAGATSVSVYLPGPEEVWYDRDTWEKFTGGRYISVDVDLKKIPVYQRGGAVVPQKNRIRRASSLMNQDPYTLVVTLDTQQMAQGELYEDDFSSFQYKNGQYVHRKFQFADDVFSSENLHPDGIGMRSDAWLERVIIVGYPRKPSSVTLITSAEKSSLIFDYDSSRNVLTIRKPGTNINQDFRIALK